MLLCAIINYSIKLPLLFINQVSPVRLGHQIVRQSLYRRRVFAAKKKYKKYLLKATLNAILWWWREPLSIEKWTLKVCCFVYLLRVYYKIRMCIYRNVGNKYKQAPTTVKVVGIERKKKKHTYVNSCARAYSSLLTFHCTLIKHLVWYLSKWVRVCVCVCLRLDMSCMYARDQHDHPFARVDIN